MATVRGSDCVVCYGSIWHFQLEPTYVRTSKWLANSYGSVRSSIDSYHMSSNICAKERVSCEGLAIFLIKAVKVKSPCYHVPGEGTLISQVVPSHPHKFPCTVKEFLSGGQHMDPLAQQLSCFFFGYTIFSRHQ